MRRLCAVLFVAGLAVGCEALKNPTPQPPPPRGEGEKAHTRPIASAESRSLTPPLPLGEGAGGWGSSSALPTASQVAPEDALLLVAKCLERGDHRGAATHLETYVRAHPDQPLFRLQLAELCVR